MTHLHPLQGRPRLDPTLCHPCRAIRPRPLPHWGRTTKEGKPQPATPGDWPPLHDRPWPFRIHPGLMAHFSREGPPLNGPSCEPPSWDRARPSGPQHLYWEWSSLQHLYRRRLTSQHLYRRRPTPPRLYQRNEPQQSVLSLEPRSRLGLVNQITFHQWDPQIRRPL